MRCKSWFRRRKRENWLLTVGYFITLTFADLISSSPTDDWIQGEEKNTTRLNEKKWEKIHWDFNKFWVKEKYV